MSSYYFATYYYLFKLSVILRMILNLLRVRRQPAGIGMNWCLQHSLTYHYLDSFDSTAPGLFLEYHIKFHFERIRDPVRVPIKRLN